MITNFDQLDVFLQQNEVIFRYIIMFVISIMLIFIICSLLYTLLNKNTI
ncbi:hypothetical protein [Phthorimaea operculella granulovirus]|uniref:Uncharacterized protein n=1 Tax=Phthorimaea operculella granulovirus TaxID=192584 RepID=Q8JS08_9BBAC|nr:hypothetical protein [Phthorimaea operculella granulovirus]AAM70249.1 hypothetical protein [Phthorimaea operculella granulovirus]ANY57440.1 hypothetical protein PhopGVgp051 [Phthorimaea operculella granulovirus]QBH65886.1 hypothetical protein PhopGVgp051 [Phthorimaea operculella granulovirus]QBH66016.1 hypothetical protein PhopGVgp051 [Phthorimaea operculella granulovirus]QBH66146.1 hypothetical protein PhopGVgp051 [Phthorimaea operculella granulovirus]